ncbi:conserved hypothetical protein [Mesorhizobium delmotii]|uniref:Uncharacterized protein n=1 Tax=Mesorhizobium delmotii TaxID=1631247 RepID=A0A2P9AF37_9HYPH|nr:conserved hypothetical protein [Mesorhizobium delmotii]
MGQRDGRFSFRKKLHDMCLARFALYVCLHEQLVDDIVFADFGRCAATDVIVGAALGRRCPAGRKGTACAAELPERQ